MADRMTSLSLPILTLAHARDLPLPRYATDGSAGMDLLAAVSDSLVLEPLARLLVPCGISLALPPAEWEAQVRPRSGLALKQGVTILNAPGIIDSDYRGEISVVLINLGEAAVTIERGMWIAQLLIASIVRITWKPCYLLPESARGVGSFGPTGLASSDLQAAGET